MKPSRQAASREVPSPAPHFAAIDFETADTGADSACAVGVVVVKEGRVAERFYRLIRPPRRNFLFTYIHGITWGQVCREPSFSELWPDIQKALGGAEFLAAHNARFDRKVLESCCLASGIAPPQRRFVCTVELARKTWSIFPTQLPSVCGRLGIPLNHHEALSDAEACARIVLAALKDGWKPAVGG
ncbi:MAG TPA: exonuclease [Elusimicrobia bacterium]|nr:exonuclease [Elusimicrobiota bacterium]HBT61540.1 exonuclease [Elusimicrobiota bacterium]